MLAGLVCENVCGCAGEDGEDRDVDRGWWKYVWVCGLECVNVLVTEIGE